MQGDMQITRLGQERAGSAAARPSTPHQLMAHDTRPISSYQIGSSPTHSAREQDATTTGARLGCQPSVASSGLILFTPAHSLLPSFLPSRLARAQCWPARLALN